jgi:hypothetical protein
VGGAVRVAVRGAVDDAVHDAVGDAVGDAVHGAVRVAVHGAVGGAVGDAVRDAVRGAVDDAVDDAVRVAVRVAVSDAVDGAVDDAVDGAVRGAVRVAVDGAVSDAVRRRWYYRLGGQWWAGWLAWRGFFRHIGLELSGDMWGRHQAYLDANRAGWWWPHRKFVIASDRPTVLHREQVAPTGWGSHRLHCSTGPAIAWGDEWALWFWHGVNVPRWVIDYPTIEAIAAEKNTEIRRCAIESLGWDLYLDAVGAKPIDVAADPGNPGHELALYDLPREAQAFNEPVRLLVMSNASLDRDGATRRRFAETVPADISDAVAAAAWQFDVSPDTYRSLERAT